MSDGRDNADAESDGRELQRMVEAMDAETERTRAIFEEAYDQVARIVVEVITKQKAGT